MAKEVTDNAFSKAVCSICYEELKPLIEDLQAISICGHVFHEFCLQQLFDQKPEGKKSRCPECKQRCGRDNVSRLYFQYTCEAMGSFDCNDDTEKLCKEVKRLEKNILGLNVAFERQQQVLKEMNEELYINGDRAKKEEELKDQVRLEAARIRKMLQLKSEELSMMSRERSQFQERCMTQISMLNEELSISKDHAKKEEALKNQARFETESIRQMLQVKSEELIKMATDRSLLQGRCMALAKELAAHKLVSGVNLDEEQVSKIASLCGGVTKDEAIDILKKSLICRNQMYEELMTQHNQLGRLEALSCKKVERAEKKIKKLKLRLQEVEREIEENDDKVLRASSKAPKMELDVRVDKVEKLVGYEANLEQTNPTNNHSLHSKRTGCLTEGLTDVLAKAIKVETDITDLQQDSNSCYSSDVSKIKFSSNSPANLISVKSLQATVPEEGSVIERSSPNRCMGSSSCSETCRHKALDKFTGEDAMIINNQNSPAEKPLHVALEGLLVPIKRETEDNHEPISYSDTFTDHCTSAAILVSDKRKRHRELQRNVTSSASNVNPLGAYERSDMIKVVKSENEFPLRLQGLGNALEENEDKDLRHSGASNKNEKMKFDHGVDHGEKPIGEEASSPHTTTTNNHLPHSKRIKCALEDQTDSEPIKDENSIVDLHRDKNSCYSVDAVELSPIASASKVPEHGSVLEHRSPLGCVTSKSCSENYAHGVSDKTTGNGAIISHQNSAAEKLLPVALEGPLIPPKRETLDKLMPRVIKGCHRGKRGGKNHRKPWTSVNLIPLGANRRGDTFILNSEKQFQERSCNPWWPNRCNYGAQQSDRPWWPNKFNHGMDHSGRQRYLFRDYRF